MATAQTHPSYGGSPSTPRFSQPHNNFSPSRVYDLPTELTPSQLEAQQILIHLLHRLQDPDSKYFNRYGQWISRHPRLSDFCLRCVRPPVWAFLSGRWSLDALKAISGDLKHEGRAVYLDGVLGLDRRMRIYVGQSVCLRQRVAQHLNFRYRRDNPSLHYHALQNSIYNTIGVVAVVPALGMGNQTLPGMDAPELLLNVLEMWMALVFRSLPEQTLEAWLPDDEVVSKARKEGREGVFGGLNVASPLDSGQKDREWLDLSDSDDPLVREYARFGVENPAQKDSGKDEEQDSPAQRQKTYAAHARGFNEAAQNDIRVPQWVAFGALAVMVGVVAFSSRGGPQRWR